MDYDGLINLNKKENAHSILDVVVKKQSYSCEDIRTVNTLLYSDFYIFEISLL